MVLVKVYIKLGAFGKHAIELYFGHSTGIQGNTDSKLRIPDFSSRFFGNANYLFSTRSYAFL